MRTSRLTAYLASCVAFTFLGLACNNDDPPTQFPQAFGEGADKHMPVRLVRYDKGILGTAGSSGEGAPKAEGGAAPAPDAANDSRVTIDDATPEGLANTMVAMDQAHAFVQMPELVLPDQKEQFEQIVNLMQPATEAFAELKKAVDEKIPGTKQPFLSPFDALPHFTSVTEVKAIDDDNAEATFQSTSPTGETPVTLKFRRIDGKWRVDMSTALQSMPAKEIIDQQTELMGRFADGVRGIAAKVRDGEITDAAGVQQEFMKLATGLRSAADGQPARPNSANPDNPEQPADAPKPEDSSTAKPKDRQPDEVDQSFSGPGMLRHR